jgi:hypothetical protein
VTIASRPSGGETAGDIEVIWVRREQKYFSNQGWTGFADLPAGQPSSVIYLHPQSTTIDFIAAKTCIAAVLWRKRHRGQKCLDPRDYR